VVLIIFSIVSGYIGLKIGGMIGDNISVYIFTTIGFFSPGLYTLEKIHDELKNRP